ncbi:MAG: hypothetical protein JW870_13545 [Candidatus Delongbacteria bacterium]|nr:hypothetical protein [Candidatus Delongbacteria bacterium]
MKKMPEYVNKYLWDVKVDALDVKKHSNFIIERILEYGDIDSLTWLQKTYEKDCIVKVLKKSKRISPKTGNFYAMYFDVPKNEFLCIRKPFTQKQDRF